jgi:acetylornithine deacetylase/succinyl-diaminopimelate desuccinylase-like protein
MSLRQNWDSPIPPTAGDCAPPPPFGSGGKGHTRLRLPTTGEKAQHSAYSVHHSLDIPVNNVVHEISAIEKQKMELNEGREKNTC